MLFVCQQVLCDAINAHHEFYVMLSELGRVERGYLTANVEVGDHLLEL